MKKKILTVLICFMICILNICSVTVMADAEESYRLNIQKLLWAGQDEERVSVYNGSGNEVPLDSLTLSNDEVLKVKKQKYLDENDQIHFDYSIEPAAPGKTTVNITFTKEDGTKGNVSRNICVKKYPKQIKSLKVCGKKIRIADNVKNVDAGKTDQRYACYVKCKKTKAAVKLSLKKGWKVKKVKSTLSAGYGDTYKDYSSKITKKMITKGMEIVFPSKWDELYITITMKNKKGEAIDYTVCLYRALLS